MVVKSNTFMDQLFTAKNRVTFWDDLFINSKVVVHFKIFKKTEECEGKGSWLLGGVPHNSMRS